jgi:prevent-host-death family protein
MVRGVGVRELKAHLSDYLKKVKAGRTVLITEHGKPVGRIVPARQPLEIRLQSMTEAGLIGWSGKKPGPISPVARPRKKRSVADLLIENRE